MRNIASVLVLSALGACGSGEMPGAGAAGAPSAPIVPTGPVAMTVPAGAAGGGALSSVPSTPTNPGSATPGTTPPAQNITPPANTTPTNTTPATPAQPSTPAMDPSKSTMPHQLAMDECGLHTKFDGDQYCIKPPPADKGFQMHIGPTNYDNPEQQYIINPGEENVVSMNTTSGNDKDVYYYYRQYRMRPGSHHVIISVNGKRIGGIQNLAKDVPNDGVIAPEDQDVALTLSAHVPMSVNIHWFNFGDKPMIREIWANYWYKDAGSVKEPALPIYSVTGVMAAVAHSHVVVGATCPITGSGRILDLYGHRHLSNVRFSIWHNSGSKHDLVYEDYDDEHPGSLDYNSLTMNPAPNPMTKTLGGIGGTLNVMQGDTLEFECEIVNNTDKNFYGANEAKDDEMCIMIGDDVGANVSAACTTKQAKMLN
jgi:hypothetical protein